MAYILHRLIRSVRLGSWKTRDFDSNGMTPTRSRQFSMSTPANGGTRGQFNAPHGRSSRENHHHHGTTIYYNDLQWHPRWSAHAPILSNLMLMCLQMFSPRIFPPKRTLCSHTPRPGRSMKIEGSTSGTSTSEFVAGMDWHLEGRLITQGRNQLVKKTRKKCLRLSMVLWKLTLLEQSHRLSMNTQQDTSKVT